MASAMYHSISSLRKAIELRPTFHFFQKIQFFLYSNSPQPSITQQQGPFASCLDSRSVIRFSGEDTIKFLQGLLTNDVRPLSDPPKEELASLPTPNQPIASHSPCYSALLTPQGRFLYDLFLYRPASRERKLGGFGGEGDDDLPFTVFADVDSECKEEVLQVLKRYRLRAKVDIEDASEEFACWQRFGAKLKESSTAEDPEAASVGWGGGVDAAGSSSAQGNSCGWRWFKDPRLSLLGYRGIFPSKTTPPLVEADEEVDERYYLLWRIEQGVAEGSSEIPKGEAIPLEYNFAGLNAISFDKGCYVGQELIARTHHRGVIRKRLLPLTFINSNGEELENHTVSPGSEVVDTSSGKNIGSVTTAVGSRGMGVLRLESALQDSASLRIKGQEDVHLKALRPEWWPAEWGHEYEQQAAA